jgi:hypothetical protein
MDEQEPTKQRQDNSIDLEASGEYKGVKGKIIGRFRKVRNDTISLILLSVMAILDFLVVIVFAYMSRNDMPSFACGVIFVILGLFASTVVCGIFILGAEKLIMIGQILQEKE